ncbi:GNAT family N-acetyltransferase [Falsiroseomonas oryziterrae]|uniref:GNAT family N-acetyltransferase n=1 Tax=Falsiroseomonas oryziterrae TaxID=2911368 RepID=UPI001F3400B4|nr:GNAT family N-acetyltransferase [Roseomonas sp. NPKOSM-4]
MPDRDYDVRVATPADLPDILALQQANLVAHGGSLSVAFPAAWLETVVREMPVVIARRDGVLAGYLVASSRAHARGQPLVEAKFAAYPAGAGAYNAGPLCIAASERGRGLALMLMKEQRRHLPGREGVAFIRADNAASRTTHAKAGYREVAAFEHGGLSYVVVARRG